MSLTARSCLTLSHAYLRKIPATLLSFARGAATPQECVEGSYPATWGPLPIEKCRNNRRCNEMTGPKDKASVSILGSTIASGTCRMRGSLISRCKRSLREQRAPAPDWTRVSGPSQTSRWARCYSSNTMRAFPEAYGSGRPITSFKARNTAYQCAKARAPWRKENQSRY